MGATTSTARPSFKRSRNGAKAVKVPRKQRRIATAVRQPARAQPLALKHTDAFEQAPNPPQQHVELESIFLTPDRPVLELEVRLSFLEFSVAVAPDVHRANYRRALSKCLPWRLAHPQCNLYIHADAQK